MQLNPLHAPIEAPTTPAAFLPLLLLPILRDRQLEHCSDIGNYLCELGGKALSVPWFTEVIYLRFVR